MTSAAPPTGSASPRHGSAAEPPHQGRRACAVVVLDVVGYSRLMEIEEDVTYRRVHRLLTGPVAAVTQRHAGILVKTTGDGALLVFDSAVDAVRGALDLLRALPEENHGQAPDRRLDLRIGVNLGEVIVEPHDIFGDAVNIAVRLQTIARPGTICVSQAVSDEIADKFSFEFEDLGHQHLKNIRRPVRAFIIDTQPRGLADARDVAIASTPVAGFEGRPAIAVLPFPVADPAGDEHRQYLGDGLADEIIQQLSGWRVFPVIARNSSFQFRGPNADVRLAGRELGARYVVTGEIQFRDQAAHVRARLIDTTSGVEVMTHGHATRLDELARAESEIALLVVGAVEPELLRVERERAARAPSRKPDAYDIFMRGLWHHYQSTPSQSAAAIDCFRRVIAVDPTNAQAHAGLAVAIMYAVQMGWRADADHSYSAAHAIARQAVDRDPRDPFARFALGGACMWLGRMSDAESEMGEAIAINPSYAAAHAINCGIQAYLGRHEAALAAGMRALRLSPHDPRLSLWLPGIARACFHLRRHDEAVSYARKALARRPGYAVPLRYLVAARGWIGDTAGLAEDVDQLRLVEPSVDGLRERLGRMYVRRDEVDHVVEGLRRAGL